MNTQASESLRLSHKIRPMLSGHGPEIQGGALADLVSLYIAGHNPAIREEVLLKFIECVGALIQPSVEQLQVAGILPGDWQKH